MIPEDAEDFEVSGARGFLERSLDYFQALLEHPSLVVRAARKPAGRPSRDFGLRAIPIHTLSPEAVQSLNLKLDPELVELLQIRVLGEHRQRLVVVSGDGLNSEDVEAMRDAVGEHFNLPTLASNYPMRVDLYEIEKRLGRYEAIADEDPPRAFRLQTRARRNRRDRVHLRRRGS